MTKKAKAASTKKYDCFAMTDKGCKALTGGRCDTCNFYKTNELLKSERQLCVSRLRELGLLDWATGKYGTKESAAQDAANI